MPSKVTFECPGCLAKLSAPDKSKLGKKIKCPKCQEVFAPEIADDDDDSFAMDDDLEEEPVDESPRRRSPAGGGGKKHAAKKGGKGGGSSEGSNTPLIIGGVVGVVVLIGAGLVLAGVFRHKAEPAVTPVTVAAAPVPAPAAPATPAAAPPAAKMPDAAAATLAERTLGLRWMPAGTDVVIHMKLAEIWNAPLLKGPLGQKSLLDEVQQTTKVLNLTPPDIESVTIGVADTFASIASVVPPVSELQTGSPGAEIERPKPGLGSILRQFVIVMKTKKAVDLNAIKKSDALKLQERKGKPYFSGQDPTVTDRVSVVGYWAPNPTTIITASEAELFATIDRGETIVPRKELSAIDATPQFVIAVVIPDIANDAKLAGLQAIPKFEQVRDILKLYSITSGSLGLSIKGGVDLRISATSGTADGAKSLKAEIDKGLAFGKEAFNGYKQIAPPLVSELGDLVFANAKISEQNQVVKLSTNVPDSAQSKLEQLPPILMVMAMTSGMGGPGLGAAGIPGSPNDPLLSTKQPGETAGVDPQKAEGLLGGMKMQARTAWGTQMTDGAPRISLDLLIDVSGEGVEKICGSAGITPTMLRLADGGTLHANASATSKPQAGDVVTETAFGGFDAGDKKATDHPPQTLRVRLSVDPPTSTATTLDVFEGTFKYLISSGSEPFTIENAVRTASRPLTQTELKRAGVNLRRSHSAIKPQSLTLWCDKDHFLGPVRGTPGDLLAFTEFDNDRTVQRLYSNHPSQLFPDDFQIQFALHSGVEEKMVRFRFENVPLPSPETKPSMFSSSPVQTPLNGQPPGGQPQAGGGNRATEAVNPAGAAGGNGRLGGRRELPPGARPDPPGVERDQNGRKIDR